jgi:hypothetical protein
MKILTYIFICIISAALAFALWFLFGLLHSVLDKIILTSLLLLIVVACFIMWHYIKRSINKACEEASYDEW